VGTLAEPYPHHALHHALRAPDRGRPARAVALAVAVAAAALLGGRAGAQAGAITFRHLSTAEGLSAGQVNALLQDRLGFVWVGTVDGLDRYDGYEVDEFRHADEDPASISDNDVSSLVQSRRGGLWVGTFGGLNYFDFETEAFARFLHDDGDAHSLVSDEVLALAEADDGTLYVGTTEGLDRLDPETGRFTHFRPDPADPDALQNGSVEKLYLDADGILWVGTQGGLHRFDPAAGTFRYYPNLGGALAENAVSALHGHGRGGLWVGTQGGGLFAFDGGAFTRVPLVEERLNQSIVISVLEDREGTLWVGTAGGGLLRRTPDGAVVAYVASRDDPTSLADDFVSALMQDRQGVLWAGTYDGVDRFDRARRPFVTYRYDPERPGTLSSNTINAVLETRDRLLLVGTNRGLNVADSTRQAFAPYALGRDPNVSALFEDREGRVWVGTHDGFYQFDPRSGRARAVDLGGVFGPAATTVVYDVAQDVQGQLWVGTVDQGLHRYDPAGGTTVHFRHDPARATSLSSDQVRVVASAPGGTLWVGTRGGLDRLDALDGGGRFTRFTPDPGDGAAPAEASILALHAAADGTLWVGTEGGGLARLDTAHPERGFSRFTEATSDLPSNTVYAVVEDENGYLWLSTSRGLARFEPATETFRVFDADGGAAARSLNRAAARGAGGALLFGSADGLLAFDPLQLSATNPYPPQVVLTGVQVVDSLVVPGPEAALRAAAPVAETIYLSHDDYVVTFEFAALHYSDPARNRYQVQLEGIERNWRDLGTDRRATYTNLGPGRYTLLVRAASADGVWTEEPLSVRIVVAPPWWRTPWAYLLYGLLFAGALVAADRFQRRRVLRQERERATRREAELRAEMAEAEARVLKVENDRKAAELEQAAELKRTYDALEESHRHLQATQAQLVQAEKLASLGQLTAGIAHEIKNPLNFVNNFADLSVELADELGEELAAHPDRPVREVLPEMEGLLADLKENARRIHEHGRRADRIVYAMLQHSRGGAGERTPTDVNELVEEYANLTYHGQRAKDTEFNVAVRRELDPEAGTVPLVPQDVGRVLINLLGNAFDAVREHAKKTGPDYLPTVTVATRRMEDGVEIRVADNGPGIPPEVAERVFEPFFTTKPSGQGTGLGLSLAYEIVTQGHGGTLRVESRPGEGATFVIELPDED
jgi:ligand-binding sensor domain-containing protein/signal transduction histidine kinase